MILTRFDYAVPATVEEAAALLAATPGSRVLAGGQSLLADLQKDGAPAPLLVDLRRVPGLRGISEGPDGTLRIGAMTTLAELADDPRLRLAYPVLGEAARSNGDPQVRNRGTVAGNLAATGRPTDLPVAAAVTGASVVVGDTSGSRTLTAEEFAALVAEDRLAGLVVTRIELPAPPAGQSGTFEKIAVRATRYPLCAVAVQAARAADGTLVSARIAVTGATPAPVRLPALEQALPGVRGTDQEVRAAVRTLPRSAFTSRPGVSQEYLTHLVGVLTARALKRIPAQG